MKALIGMLVVGVLAYFVWQRGSGAGTEVIDDPVYGEIRIDLEVQGRELEMALFARLPDDGECQTRATQDWQGVFEACPACNLHPVQCRDELPPRYARLFDDEPISSWYVSMQPGMAGERQGRLVVYGLTDQEGAVVCKELLKAVKQKYRGTARCVAPAG